MENKTKLDAKEDILLNNLRKLDWLKIIIQGGDFIKWKRDKLYLLPGLWIDIGRHILVHASSVELGNKNEVFKISLEDVDSLNIPETDKMFNPPRKVVGSYPSDLPLNSLLGGGVNKIHVIENVIDEKHRSITVDVGFLIESKDGKRFSIRASNVIPLSIEVREI